MMEQMGPSGLNVANSRKRFPRWLWWVIGGFIGIAMACLAGVLWYAYQVKTPLDRSSEERVRVEVVSGMSPQQIADLLEGKKLIRSATIFLLYTRIHGVQHQLQAGVFSLSPSESVPEIVEHLRKGLADEFTLTFLPGATLTDTTNTPENKKMDVTTVLLRAGYEKHEIEAALEKTYDHPLFRSKPASADLEGYVYGETYTFHSGASVEQILTRTFDEFYAQVQKHGLAEFYEKQGLTLYEGITLASIIQRESGGEDKEQIAQVFYKRLSQGMQLGSDVTYQYAADKMGVPRDTNLDSPYNTRRYAGLPPGPIASPGLDSLLAAAHPADGDYLYFLSGDDDVTYYGRTEAEHQANIKNHCQKKCLIL